MVETLREAKIICYIDTTKATRREVFNLQDYKNIKELLKDAKKWLESNLPEG